MVLMSQLYIHDSFHLVMHWSNVGSLAMPFIICSKTSLKQFLLFSNFGTNFFATYFMLKISFSYYPKLRSTVINLAYDVVEVALSYVAIFRKIKTNFLLLGFELNESEKVQVSAYLINKR